jgi:phospholipase C
VRVEYDAAIPGVRLYLSNVGGTAACTFTVSDNGYGTASTSHAVNAGAIVVVSRALGASFGWYDLSVRSSSDSQYLRRVAGHVETGSASRTDPVIGTNRNQQVALAASAAYVQKGLGFALTYTCPAGKLDPKNWIGVYGPGKSPGNGAAAAWAYAPQASGTWTADSSTLPVADYNAWYLFADGYETLGGPVPFCVTTLTTTTPSVTKGQAVSIQFAMPQSRVKAKNWIGIWTAGVTPGAVKWLAWKYVTTASGSASFDTSTLAVGNYSAWMLFDDGYQILGGPCAFTVR